MWQQQPDYARYKEKLTGEGWLGSVPQSTRRRTESHSATADIPSQLGSCLMFRIRTFSQSSRPPIPCGLVMASVMRQRVNNRR